LNLNLNKKKAMAEWTERAELYLKEGLERLTNANILVVGPGVGSFAAILARAGAHNCRW
jgi:tRNA A37 threonylcarbamoyladenosine dehydratase